MTNVESAYPNVSKKVINNFNVANSCWSLVALI